jgi:DNA-binding response OmpR family regulator
MKIDCLLLADKEYEEFQKEKLSTVHPNLKVREIVSVNSVWNAVREINRKDFDVVLLDYELGLPYIHGTDIIKELRPLTDAVIIAIMEVEDETANIDALRAGADDVRIRKYISQESMRAGIITNITRKRIRETKKRIAAKLHVLEEFSFKNLESI